MSRIRSTDTSLELKVRKYLFSKGLRYRLHSDLPGKPDIIFPGEHVAVFINGCFWHMHGCKLSTIPTSRRDYWRTKLEKNRERDTRVNAELTALGWKTVTVWECEVDKNIDEALLPLVITLKDK